MSSGGRINDNGYVLLKRRDHPMARKNGYIGEHTLVMESMIGRHLLPRENVHHKNAIRNDNRPENLELWTRVQPAGARVEDLLVYARWVLETYGTDAD